MMGEFTHWRGFDLTARIAKIKRVFNCEPVTSAEDVPILVNSPCYFSFGSRDKPTDYYTNPASMLASVTPVPTVSVSRGIFTQPFENHAYPLRDQLEINGRQIVPACVLILF